MWGWKWLPPDHADILVLDDGLELHVPNSSCHGGYLCKSSFVMKEPGKYTCFVQRMNGRAVFGIGDKNSNTNQYIWGNYQRGVTSSCGTDGCVMQLDITLGYTTVEMTVREATEKCELVPDKEPLDRVSRIIIRGFPYCVVAGLDHGSRFRAHGSYPESWSPHKHGSMPPAFRAFVKLVLLCRQATTKSSLALMPPELMFVLFELVYLSWTQADLRNFSNVTFSGTTSNRRCVLQ